MKKNGFLLLLLFSLFSAFSQNHAPVAVNDTIYATVGDTVVVTRTQLLHNDYDPDGDSIRLWSVSYFHRVNDTTYRYVLSAIHNRAILHFSYRIKDQYFYSVPDGDITIFVRGGIRDDSLDVNNISATISSSGQHFWNFETARFEVPRGSGKHSVFNHTMWMGALKDGDTLCTAAERYRANGNDFFAGPVSTVRDSSYYIKWNRVWKVDKTQIQYHINNFNQPGYQAIDVIANWPAHGDAAFGQSEDIAPYYDKNNNGLYEPLQGDYPLIRGDQAVFFVFNDAANIHTESHGYPLGIDIYGMAYGYNRPADSTLNNTLFMHYDIVNRSANNYHDAFIGLFTDFDLGYAGDDYIASDVTNGMAYCYNGLAADGNGEPFSYGEHPPAIGMKVIGGPYLEPDGIDNLSGECGYSLNGLNFGDNVADNERLGMTNFLNMAIQNGWQTGDPDVAINYYNYMKSIWKDASKMIYGGNGHLTTGGLGPECNFMFPGNSDTVCNYGTNGILPNGGLNQNGNYWTEATAGNVAGDRRGVASVGPFNFDAGETIPLDYCFSWARDYNGDNIASAELLRTRMAALAPSWGTLIQAPQSYLGNKETETGKSIKVFPNPANTEVYVILGEVNKQPYFLFSANGSCVKQGVLLPGTNKIELSGILPGVYTLKTNNEVVRVVKISQNL